MRGWGAVLIAFFFAAFTSAAFAAAPSLSPEANAQYLRDNAKKPGWVVRPSGLQYRIVHSGYGKRPGPRDVATIYYSGQLINGKVFDGTEQGLPAQFKVQDLIPGWTEALQLMREGDHWQLVIPTQLAYGARGAGDGLIPPNQTLIFDITLVSVTTPKEEPKKEDTSTGNQPDE